MTLLGRQISFGAVSVSSVYESEVMASRKHSYPSD